jgi:hypothetical protein
LWILPRAPPPAPCAAARRPRCPQRGPRRAMWTAAAKGVGNNRGRSPRGQSPRLLTSQASRGARDRSSGCAECMCGCVYARVRVCVCGCVYARSPDRPRAAPRPARCTAPAGPEEGGWQRLGWLVRVVVRCACGQPPPQPCRRPHLTCLGRRRRAGWAHQRPYPALPRQGRRRRRGSGPRRERRGQSGGQRSLAGRRRQQCRGRGAQGPREERAAGGAALR